MTKKIITQNLIKNGYHKFKLKNKNSQKLKQIITKNINDKTKKKIRYLDEIHNHLNVEELNNFRLFIFKKINNNKKFRENIFYAAQEQIEACVGSEICSSDANLSIQYPNDESSLLSMHTDFFSGESIFQVNLWVPFVNVKKTQSMFIINPENSLKILEKIKKDKNLVFNNIDEKYKSKMKWINLKEGEAMMFSPNCLHGNVVNRERKTRWSINIRFKNLFSPYSKYKNEKKIGTFYKPMNLSSITQFNLRHNFDEIS